MLEIQDKAFVWHPFTAMREYLGASPLIIKRGRGIKLQDTRGRWYFDGTSSIWLNVHGHRVEKLDAAIRSQLDLIAHSTLLGQGNVPSIILAKRLVEIAPGGLGKVFYSDSGATAVEIALKMAVQYWANLGQPGRRLIVGFSGGYHGDTLGAVGVAHDDLFHWPFLGLLPPHPIAPYPRPDRGQSDDERRARSLAAVEKILHDREGEIGAVIVEPVQGAAGIVPPPGGFLAGLREICDRFQVLLIVDEVATGFGRTGRLFACEAEGVAPDLLCLGKGLTGGYLPLAATLATQEIFDAFLTVPGRPESRRRTFFHGHSYTGNPLACAAALASLDLLEELLPELPAKAAALAGALAPLRDRPFVGEVRQAGLMAGIDLVADRASGRPFPAEPHVGFLVARHIADRGMIIRPIGSTLVFVPPLAATFAELEEMGGILRNGLDDAALELERIARGG
ncbi:MAG: adenosylmethionine--8-amino-7-oxononanoate transaminase [Acidobacteria bacterium]|nr:adenosylmethionine--8-amino-7-oxononanoate transaminase [Acidobacteriota bacterium]